MPVVKSVEEAVKEIKSGQSVMVGGFLGVGAPIKMLDTLAETEVKNLTLISVVSSNPAGNFDLAKLISNRQVKKMITSHTGTNRELVQQYLAGAVDVEYNPMGTWTERIRAGGAGLGGILTPTGIGTEMEKGREKVVVDGKPFLLYPPLKANIALVKAHRADKAGNLEYRGLALNSNPVIATAADLVIAEVDEIVETGEIDMNRVGTPGIFVDIIVKGYGDEERKEIFEELWTKSGLLR